MSHVCPGELVTVYDAEGKGRADELWSMGAWGRHFAKRAGYGGWVLIAVAAPGGSLAILQVCTTTL